jgi:hypothetical protein
MVMFIVFIPNLLNNILLSYLSIEANKEKFLFKTVLLNLMLSGFVGFIFYILSNQIFALFGADFKESGTDVFINLIYAIIPFCSSLVLLQYLISIKKRWSYLFFRFLREGLTIGMFLIFINLNYVADAMLLSKCFLYANYISLLLLIFFIIINYFYERKKVLIKS